jgi:hypothetical protein
MGRASLARKFNDSRRHTVAKASDRAMTWPPQPRSFDREYATPRNRLLGLACAERCPQGERSAMSRTISGTHCHGFKLTNPADNPRADHRKAATGIGDHHGGSGIALDAPRLTDLLLTHIANHSGCGRSGTSEHHHPARESRTEGHGRL